MARILGLSFGHDAAAALVVDGHIVAAAEEERFVGVKHSVGFPLPLKSIDFCLSVGGLQRADIDVVALFKPIRLKWYREFIRPMATAGIPFLSPRLARNLTREALQFFRETEIRRDPWGLRGMGFREGQVRGVPHHVAHAASAYYCSGLAHADILVADAAGSHEATSLYHGDGATMELTRQVDWPDSLGYFYSALTEYLGYETREGEGRIMGLAPYGQHDPQVAAVMERVCQVTPQGYSIDQTLVGFAPPYSIPSLERELGPRARSIEDLDGPRLRNIAYELQKRLEDVIVHLLDKWGVGSSLALAGGVALNCKMNGVIAETGRFDDIFIQPAANDPGSALGAALAVARDWGDPVGEEMRHAYLGPEFTEDAVAKELESRKIPYEKIDDIEDAVAEYLARGEIVGWFQGKMEFGPRALGNRSILMSPTKSENKDVLNALVKFREAYRPYCPSMLSEAADEYLVDARPSPFMILSFWVKPEKRSEIPAVTHVDGSCRPQTVRRDVQPLYWRLIHQFEERTSVPVLLNTSLNVRGKPMACTPSDALAAFYMGGMDRIAFGKLLVSKTHKR